MKASLSFTLFAVMALYLGIGALLFFAQRALLYFPTPVISHGFQTQVFHHDGESLNVIVVNPNQPDAILYFGGNGEGVAHNAISFAAMFPRQTAYLVNYRGYGGSSGAPHEKGIYGDALHIFDEVQRVHASITVIGRSLGSGVATLLASERDLDRLVLVTPYDSIKNVAQGRFPIYPMSLLLKDKYDSLGRVGKIDEPVLVLMAEFDEVIPIARTRNLVKAFDPDQITAHVIENTGHNTISQSRKYQALLSDFAGSRVSR